MTTTPLAIAVPRETLPGELRVALVPDTVGRLVKAGHAVRIERGAGAGARVPDSAYEAAGATLADGPAAALTGAALVLKVRPPTPAETAHVPADATLISHFQPQRDGEALAALQAKGVRVLSMDFVPRSTLAQSMDALSSQASVAGYEAALLGASLSPKFMPMLVTAAGTIPPANVLVLGAGVAGLMAIATARRLGAKLSAYDIRPEVKEEIESLGATFVAGEAVSAEARADQGYAREVGEEMRRRQEAALAKFVADADVLITTAQVFGRKAPILVTRAMAETMKSGAVIVDIAAETGGNCELTQAGETIVHHGVTVAGPLNLPSRMPLHASTMYARNLYNVVQHLSKSGTFTLDPEDEIVKGMLRTPGGAR
jgi:NAD(P) transhydrogenase subunit alpha